MTDNRTIGGLAEIALRVTDLKRMTEFYLSVIGLELMSQSDNFVFFRIADGFAGHTQVLALFDRRTNDDCEPSGDVSPDATRTTVDHLAFAIAREDFESEVTRLRDLGCKVRLAYHKWVQWRSLYVSDPEGNLVELVCYDPTGESWTGK